MLRISKMLKRSSDLPLDKIRQWRHDVRMNEIGYDRPDAGQCGVVSEVLHVELGLRMNSGFYLEQGSSTPHEHQDHVWNVLPDGRILDATHDQFGPPDILITSKDDPRYHSWCDNPECPHCTCEVCNPGITEELKKTSKGSTRTASIEEYSDEDLKTDWLDILDEIQWEIPAALVERIVKLNGLYFVWKLNKRMLLLNDKVWLLYDQKDKTLEYIKDIQRWVIELDTSELEDIVGDVDNIYNPFAEESLNDLRQHPGDVYHYTTAENIEKIKSSGVLKGSSGTGLTNRSSYGVFTSLSPETNASGSYGDICLKINLTAFLKENPNVCISWEPEIEECLMRDALEGGLGLDSGGNYPDSSGGMSFDTLIIGSNIPMKFISVEDTVNA